MTIIIPLNIGAKMKSTWLKILLFTLLLSNIIGQVNEFNAVYLARTFVINEDKEQVLDELARLAMPTWNHLSHEGSLTTQQLYETVEIYYSESGQPHWNYLLLSQIPLTISINNFFKMESSLLGSDTLLEEIGLELLRSEVLIPTPNSYYPYPISILGNTELEINYLIEYISVNKDQLSLDEYRSIMKEYFGAGEHLLIAEGKRYNFIALETTKVLFSKESMPLWNQIHIVGRLPDIENPNILTAVMRAKGIEWDQMQSIINQVLSIRTKPREDWGIELSRFRIE